MLDTDLTCCADCGVDEHICARAGCSADKVVTDTVDLTHGPNRRLRARLAAAR